MKRFFVYLGIISKRILKNPILLALFVCIPCFALLASRLDGFTTGESQKAGIYFTNDSEFSEGFYKELKAHSSAFEFILYEDRDEMFVDVAKGILQSGYVFPKDFEQRVEEADLKKLIKTYVSPSTTTAAAIDEIVHSIIMKYNGYTVLKNILKEELKSIPPDSETIDYMFERYEYYCDSDETFHINVEKIDTVSDEAVRLTEENYVFTFPLRGVLSILIYLSGMLGAVLYLSDKRKQIFDAHTPEFTIFSRQAYVLIPVTIFILVSLITLVFSQNAYLPAKEILLMLRYILVILLFTNLCTVLVKDPAMLIPILVVQVIGSLVFCPIFIDIGSAFPVMKIMSYLFVSGYYL